ncbi:hypothetical protein D8T26_10025 [Vibrio vulnificus]|uniref:Uncharacterized protein n=1 Tax=Vibrio vulnificus TaxID=672 RepID=A0A1W6M8K7_VIBVL|nr:hypothetical protein FORC36_3088 [Vibrio vulnificus]POB46080.1 hypothetical protein CRN52_15490 [Vibrio vulnificus]RZP79006.1 hypothetical protein D8T60_09350 [Vibrio vulnificus]RZQ87656.1 hypothetical protein D8T26_10025 [Vibrio vulnificus]RZR19907.1 hypothetical protein D8T64_14855 [Vibrio vulnificus]
MLINSISSVSSAYKIGFSSKTINKILNNDIFPLIKITISPLMTFAFSFMDLSNRLVIANINTKLKIHSLRSNAHFIQKNETYLSHL